MTPWRNGRGPFDGGVPIGKETIDMRTRGAFVVVTAPADGFSHVTIPRRIRVLPTIAAEQKSPLNRLGFGLKVATGAAGVVHEARWVFAVPYWFVLAGTAALPARRLALHLRRRRRRGRLTQGLCPRCGYDLRATPGRCPECGHSNSAA
jgi:hypothetical protein